MMKTHLLRFFLLAEPKSLKFQGQKVPYFDSHIYLSFRTVLFRGPCNIDEGSSATWPLNSELPIVPTKSKLEVSDGKDAQQPQLWLEARPQKAAPLPPSFDIKDETGVKAFSNHVQYKASVA